jgi:hypothetical protein
MAMNHRVFGVSGVFALSLIACSAEAATILPDAVYSGYVDIGAGQDGFEQNVQGPGTVDGSVAHGGASTSGSVTILPGPAPSLSTTLTATAPNSNSDASGSTEGELTYALEILGPSGDVPINIHAAGGSSVAGQGAFFQENQTIVQFQVYDPVSGGGATTNELSSYGYDELPVFDSNGDTFLNDGTYTMETNKIYDVQLTVYAELWIRGELGGGAGAFTAFVDPTFAIGPGVADPSQYSFVFSNGIGNSSGSPVPEPSTWAMMLLGFAGLGLSGYRSARRKIAIAA